MISNCHRFNQSELKKTVKRFNRLLKRLSSVAGKASLRGHRDDRRTVQEEPRGNHGNFLALLQIRMDSGDKFWLIFSNLLVLVTIRMHALYTSKTVQNEIINVCGDIIRSNLLDNIRAAGAFSIKLLMQATRSSWLFVFGM